MDTCRKAVEELLRTLEGAFDCREVDGVTWLITPYRLADGDLIELAISEAGAGTYVITDTGETARHLANHGFDPSATPTGRLILETIAARTGVEPVLPEVRKTVPASELGEAILDVVLGCLALADTLYLSRAYQATEFVDEVAQVFRESGLTWQSNKEVVGKSGHPYRVHFAFATREQAGTGEALVQALTARKPRGVKRVVDAATRMWFDVADGKWLASVLDDRFVAWPGEDVRLLERLSHVYRWSEKGRLVNDLAAMTGR